MRKITGKELKELMVPEVTVRWRNMNENWRASWEKKAEAINSFFTQESDEQSNECPIPTIQEGD